MSWTTGTASSSADLLDKLNAFLLKGHTLPPVYTGTGNGTLSGAIGTASSVHETITVTLTSSTAFSVSGSVTGSMGTGTVGTAFSHAKVAFLVNAGSTAWVSGDTIQFVMTPPYTQMRGVAGSEYIWRAPGNANADQIFVGASRFYDTGSGNYDNWRLGGFTGYGGANTFTNQPGAETRPVLTLWNGEIPYWFIADGARVKVVAKVSSVYACAYLGFAETYPSPGQLPYPLVVGGNMAWSTEPALTSANWRYSYTGLENSAFFQPLNATNDRWRSLRLRRPDGSWQGFDGTPGRFNTIHGDLWPWTTTMSNVRPALDGSYVLLPIMMFEAGSEGGTNAWGELSGVMAVTGHGNGSENTVVVGRETWLVVQNVHRTAKNNYAAFRLA